MTFIRTVPPEEATGLVKELYDAELTHLGYVPNYTRALSLHPEVFVGWRNLNKEIRSRMDLRRYELVTIATASRLRCSY